MLPRFNEWPVRTIHVRLGIASEDAYIQELNTINEQICMTYREQMRELIRMVRIKVMLGDSTITEQETFDPNKVREYYNGLPGRLTGWDARAVSLESNEDLRRIFVKFGIREGNYLLSGHLSIQFHVLLYYKPDYRVVECQKELEHITKESVDSESAAADAGEAYMARRMNQMGLESLGSQEIFEMLYNDDALAESLYEGLENNLDEDLRRLSKRKRELFNELDGLLVETYQTTDVLLDDARLVTGEEGMLCTFDLDLVKGELYEGVFDPRRIPYLTRDRLKRRLDEFLHAI